MVTDALEMGGIAKGFSAGDAAVRALEAGADALLMPADPEAAIRAVVAAVESGRLTRQRIQESVVKILAAKEKVGLDRKRFVDLEAIGDVIDYPEANEKAQEIADRAVTLVRNGGNLVPLAAPEPRLLRGDAGEPLFEARQVFTQEVRKRRATAPLVTLDPSYARPGGGRAARQARRPAPDYAVAAFAPVDAYRGTVGLAGDLPHAIGDTDRRGQAGGAGGAGQSLPAAQLSAT